MRYEVEGDDLCIRIPLDAIVMNVEARQSPETADPIVIKVVDKRALAMSLGRELCECEDMGEDYYLSRVLDDALRRVVESADPALTHDGV